MPQTLLAQYGDPQQIYGWLMGRLGRVPGTQVDDFSGAVHQRIAADYRDGRLCDFHGWPMSETECALIAARAQRTPLTGPEERSFSNAVESSWLDVRNWGPQSTRRGHVFNPQPDGHGGIWFQASGDVSSAVIVINGFENPITLNDSGFTTGVHGAVLARLINDPGPHAIWVYDFSRHRKQKIGDFIVDP